MAPPGTKALIHEKPSQRASWDPHAVEGWYLGPSLEHYRCVRVYIPSTFSERITDTVEYFPHDIKFPVYDTNQFLKRAASDILAALNTKTNPPPGVPPHDTFQQAIKQTALLLHRATTMSTPSKPPTANPYTQSLPRVEKNNIKKKNTQAPRVEQPVTTPPPVSPPHRLHHGSINFKQQALHFLQSQLAYQPKCFHIFNKQTGKKETIDTLRAGAEGKIWDKAVSNEFG